MKTVHHTKYFFNVTDTENTDKFFRISGRVSAVWTELQHQQLATLMRAVHTRRDRPRPSVYMLLLSGLALPRLVSGVARHSGLGKRLLTREYSRHKNVK